MKKQLYPAPGLSMDSPHDHLDLSGAHEPPGGCSLPLLLPQESGLSLSESTAYLRGRRPRILSSQRRSWVPVRSTATAQITILDCHQAQSAALPTQSAGHLMLPLHTESSISSVEAALRPVHDKPQEAPPTSLPTKELASLLSRGAKDSSASLLKRPACPLHMLDEAQLGAMSQWHSALEPPKAEWHPVWGGEEHYPPYPSFPQSHVSPTSAGDLGLEAGLSRTQTLRALQNLVAQGESRGGDSSTGAYLGSTRYERSCFQPGAKEGERATLAFPEASKRQCQDSLAASCSKGRTQKVRQRAEKNDTESGFKKGKAQRVAGRKRLQDTEEIDSHLTTTGVEIATHKERAFSSALMPGTLNSSESSKPKSDRQHVSMDHLPWPRLFGVHLIPQMKGEASDPAAGF